MIGGSSGRLVCVVTGNRNFVAGGIPVFVHDDEQERQRLALYIAKITQGMVHDLEGGTYIVARH